MLQNVTIERRNCNLSLVAVVIKGTNCVVEGREKKVDLSVAAS